jgi:hypothetical protein
VAEAEHSLRADLLEARFWPLRGACPMGSAASLVMFDRNKNVIWKAL